MLNFETQQIRSRYICERVKEESIKQDLNCIRGIQSVRIDTLQLSYQSHINLEAPLIMMRLFGLLKSIFPSVS